MEQERGLKKTAFLYLHSACYSLFPLSTFCVGVYWEGDAYLFWCDLSYPRTILAIEESSIPSMVPLQACALFCPVLSEKRKVGLTTLFEAAASASAAAFRKESIPSNYLVKLSHYE